MKLKRQERRKMQRYQESFKDTEERDAFLAKKFPVLVPGEKPGHFSTPSGSKVTVWISKVLWSEPLEGVSE